MTTASTLFLIAALPLLAIAAARDVATRLIPDGISIAIAVMGLVTRGVVGWSEALVSLGVAAGLFLLLLLLAMRGALGGGDVKLMAAMATGLAPADTWSFIVATVMAGGILGLAYLFARHLVPEASLAPGGALLRRVMAVEARRIRRRGPLPYAVAIAAGGMFLLFSLSRA
ncbi:A24 family peptidase [Neoroseomonas marina]|uniref:A24 family peptidase n=1 Tax=Neoroseomonas marina TaxID=1232220 RepID=UPI0030B9DC73